MKYTVKELVEKLKCFPDDLVIENDISLIWDYPDALDSMKGNYSDSYFNCMTKMWATKLFFSEKTYK